MHSSGFFMLKTHAEVDQVIAADSGEPLTWYPEDVALEVSLYQIADRETKKRGTIGKEEFLEVIGKG